MAEIRSLIDMVPISIKLVLVVDLPSGDLFSINTIFTHTKCVTNEGQASTCYCNHPSRLESKLPRAHTFHQFANYVDRIKGPYQNTAKDLPPLNHQLLLLPYSYSIHNEINIYGLLICRRFCAADRKFSATKQMLLFDQDDNEFPFADCTLIIHIASLHMR